MAICRGCGSEIKWAKMETGGSMPLDPKEIKIVRIQANGKGKVIGGYIAHWATCPAADKFRPGDHRKFAKK